MKRLIALLSLCLVGCGADNPIVLPVAAELLPEARVSEGLDESVNVFLGECDAAGVECRLNGMSIEWADDLEDKVQGVCIIPPLSKFHSFRRIRIRTQDWDQTALDLVVAHELGHCVLDLDHTHGNKPHVMRSSVLNKKERRQKTTGEWISEMFIK